MSDYVATSPDFGPPDESVLGDFWSQHAGGHGDVGGGFFNSDIIGCSSDIAGRHGTIEVWWFDDPVDPQRTIDIISDCFGFTLPAFSTWTISKKP